LKRDSTWAAVGKLIGGAALETVGRNMGGNTDIIKGNTLMLLER
jgi:hypothetical protein